MVTLKNVLLYTVLICLAFAAWVQIGISWETQKLTTPLNRSDYGYAVTLVLSVVYLRWVLRAFLIPWHGLRKDQIAELRRAIKYRRGFGVIGLGYICLGLHISAFLQRSLSHRPSFIGMALFLIALGVFAETRAAVQYLCEVNARQGQRIQESRGDADATLGFRGVQFRRS